MDEIVIQHFKKTSICLRSKRMNLLNNLLVMSEEPFVKAPCRVLTPVAEELVDGFANLTATRLPGIAGAEVVGRFLMTLISCLSDSSNKPRICEVQISGKTTSGPFIRPSNARALSSFSTTLMIQSIGKVSIEVVRFKLSVMPFWTHCTTNCLSFGTFKKMKSAIIISVFDNFSELLSHYRNRCQRPR